MNKYILMLVWVMICALFLSGFRTKKVKIINGKREVRTIGFVAVLTFIPLIIWSANRGYFADTTAYLNAFDAMPSSFNDMSSYLETISKDVGFSFISVTIKCLFGNSHEVYLFIIALIQSAGIIYLYVNYSSSYAFSLFLFVASTDYLSWMFNGMRQFTAVCLLLLSTPFMIENKRIDKRKRLLICIVLVLVISTIHQSALLMIPFIFISQGKAWNKKTILLIVMTLCAIIFVDKFTNIMDEALANTQYVNVVSDYTSWDDDGTNPLRVFVYIIPTLLSIIGRKKIAAVGDKRINFFVNMSIISSALYVISMYTSGIFIGRLPIYCSLYNYVLLPWEIKHIFGRQNATIITMITVICYLIFYYFVMHFQNGLI